MRTRQEQRAYSDGLSYIASLEAHYRALGEAELRAIIREFNVRGFGISAYGEGIVAALKVLAADLHDEAAAS